jgi:outer membrane protein assembly factor BamA
MSADQTVHGVGRPHRYLDAQHFEGASRIAASALAAATGLNKGATLSPEMVNAARRAILDMYAKSSPGPVPSLKCRMQTTIEGKVTLTWIIGESG